MKTLFRIFGIAVVISAIAGLFLPEYRSVLWAAPAGVGFTSAIFEWILK